MVKPRAILWALSLPPFLLLGLFFIVPIFLMFALSFCADMQNELFSLCTPTPKQYHAAFELWPLLRTSIAMSLVVAVMAIALAYPVAYFLVFRAGRAAGFCLLLLLIPFFTNFLLRVMSWTYVLGSNGAINWLLFQSGAEPIGDLFYSRSGVVITLIYVWIPFAALPIAAALKGIDPELIEAALDLGASPWRCFRTITFPLSLPGVLAAFFMVFIPTVGEYATPLLVGAIPRGTMYGNLIYYYVDRQYDLPRGAALSAVMLFVALLLVGLAKCLVNLKAVRMTQKQAVISARARFSLLDLYFAGLIALLYVPLAVLVLLSLNTGPSPSFPLKGISFLWYEQLLQHFYDVISGRPSPSYLTEMLRSARNSILVAAGSSCVATSLGTAVALLHMRFSFRGKKLLFAVAMLPLIMPVIILAVALLVLFHAAGIDRSLWTLAIAHSVVALPYVILIISARLAIFDPDLEEAAMDLGAPYGMVILNIVLPLIAPSILSSWLVALTVSLDEFALALFVAGTNVTFPVYLYGQFRFGDRQTIMIAFAVLMITSTLLLALIAEWIRRRGQSDTVR